MFFHAHGTASATDIAGQAEKFLDGHQLHILVPGGLGGLFQIQRGFCRKHENAKAAGGAPGHQRFEDPLGLQPQQPGHRDPVHRFLAMRVAVGRIGNAGLLQHPHHIGLIFHSCASVIR